MADLTWIHLVAALPWLGWIAFAVFRVRLPRELPAGLDEGGEREPLPRISVIVPARNESRNVETVIRTLARSDYPDFEIFLVDDRSDDDTLQRARRAARDLGNADRIEVIEGTELPDGWLGKPWACAQGAERATGDLLLFTDADTTHGPRLLERAVAGLREDRADVVAVAGSQILGSFWERLVQPHIFTALIFRFPDMRQPLPPERWKDAIANGQYLLFTRESYEEIGGHEAVRAEVAEDLRLAQILVKSGHRLSIRLAEDELATRMYTNLGEIVEGWSKNVVVGGRQTLPDWQAAWLPWVGIPVGLLLWWVPPAVVLVGLVSAPGEAAAGWTLWASGVTALSALFWAAACHRLGASALYGPLYPFGALVGLAILSRALWRGNTVEWKGRTYRVGN